MTKIPKIVNLKRRKLEDQRWGRHNIWPNTESKCAQHDLGTQELYLTSGTGSFQSELVLGANSAASPTTPRGSFTPRCFNTPRMPGAWSHQNLRILETALLPGTLTHPGSQNHRITGSQRQLELWGVLTQPGSQEGQAPVRYSKGR